MRYWYVTNSTQKFSSPYDGLIGICPGYSGSTAMIGNSDFVIDLIRNKMIDFPIISIYTRNEVGNSSTVKFGGWDQSALADGETLKMY